MRCLIFFTITTPDELELYMYGPEEGRRSDTTLYWKSNLEDMMQNSLLIHGEQCYVYGDLGFLMRPCMQVAYCQTLEGPTKTMYNGAMDSAREAVEWLYKNLKQNFTAKDFRRMLKAVKASIALMYKASDVLWNMKMCMNHDSHVTVYFRCTPPTPDGYLESLNEI